MDGSTRIAAMAGLSILSDDSQHDRLLRLDFPRHDAPANAVLLVNSIDAVEELSRDFAFRVELISDNAHIAASTVMAKMATVSMVRNDGSLRYFNGYITEFRLVRADGGLAFYHMLLEPWLAFARLTEDCYSFHLRSVIELTEDTFADYLERDWKVRLIGQYPKLTCANQYNETDHNHLHRRWEAAGLYYWYEHRADGHTLWLSDFSLMADPIDAAGGEIRFRAESGSTEDDSIREWQPVRRIKPSRASLASFDYKNPFAHVVQKKSLNQQGDVFAREVYQDAGYGFSTMDDGDARAERKMHAIVADALQFVAKGNHRNALPGRKFKLAEHFSTNPPRSARNANPHEPVGASEYLIVKVAHAASNNYQDGKGAPSHYDNELTCVRSTTHWRPMRGHNSVPYPDPGILTAIVVGRKGEEIHTDEMGRVRVQFHWDRVGQFDVNSSPWIRVMMPLAGCRLGQQMIPRVKQEVAVQFVAGNIDHPIIVGGDYNSINMPPWRLPDGQPLMGLRSRELSSRDGKSGGERSNHLILDDTNGKIQAQLKSDHQHSQLSLGHITRIEDNAGRKDFRGEGWELRTDGHGVARAAKGLLLTTEERNGARSHIKDIGETEFRLRSAHGRHDGLAQLAQQHDAKDGGQQAEVATSIQKQNDDINGGGSDGFPQLSAPHLVLASPAGIESTTSGSTHVASDQHTAVTTGRSLSIAAGDSLFASVRQAVRIFVHKAGMKLIAAAGDVDVQALSDSINLLAKLNITQSANRITITAKEEIVINGGGSYAKLSSGGIELGTNGNHVSHASKHSLIGPKNMEVANVMPPKKELAGKGALNLGTHPAAGGRASAGMPFTLFKDGAALETGAIDEQGNMTFAHELEAESKYAVELPNGLRFVVDPDEHIQEHEMSAGVGFHGYSNAGGSLADEHAALEQDRLIANPAMRNREEPR